eukprot:CAMPEP_0206361020 /NCGR_PEP_ID=MMETSP0294-20121207/83_1 /ASSEMBLY_ACC=CAM_ASM_000327 /TAXON_ID=39354 /ORGANISM="Heterosigma akashiwo, Strain CCMP2393" /LENGTH=246 /DNA_ID=CAMNT_0053805765 /DNA_START=698 /DNA_END=1435 /DNA_ORIENTATION=+
MSSLPPSPPCSEPEASWTISLDFGGGCCTGGTPPLLLPPAGPPSSAASAAAAADSQQPGGPHTAGSGGRLLALPGTVRATALPHLLVAPPLCTGLWAGPSAGKGLAADRLRLPPLPPLPAESPAAVGPPCLDCCCRHRLAPLAAQPVLPLLPHSQQPGGPHTAGSGGRLLALPGTVRATALPHLLVAPPLCTGLWAGPSAGKGLAADRLRLPPLPPLPAESPAAVGPPCLDCCCRHRLAPLAAQPV